MQSLFETGVSHTRSWFGRTVHYQSEGSERSLFESLESPVYVYARNFNVSPCSVRSYEHYPLKYTVESTRVTGL